MRHLNFYHWIYSDNKGAKQRFVRWLLFILFSVVLVGFKLRYHELWKDEWQAWFVARDMPFSQMLGFLYYEGHPSLWYIYLKFGTFVSGVFSSQDVALQVLHSVPVVCILYMLLVRMRFSTVFAALLCLGYFIAFEYGVVNRGYAFVILFALMAAYWMEDVMENMLKIGVCLFLLCQTEVQGVFIAFLLFFYCIWKDYDLKNSFFTVLNTKPFKVLGLSFGMGALFFLLTVFPRGDQETLSRAYNGNSRNTIFETFATAFQGHFVNTFWIGAQSDTKAFGYNTLGLTLSCLLLILLSWIFYNHKKLLTIWLLSIVLFLGFATLLFSGGVRQWGMFYIVFVVLLYLWRSERAFFKLDKLLILTSIIAFQIYYSVLAFQKDWAIPYSNGAAAAAFVKEKIPAAVPIIAINKFYATPVIGYANRSMIEMPSGEPFTYSRWLDKVYLPSETDFQLYTEYKKIGGLVVMSGEPLPLQQYPHLEFWTVFKSASLKNENFYFYQYKKQAKQAN